MEEVKHIGFRIDELSKLTKSAVNRGMLADGANPMVMHRAWIIGYLSHHEDLVVCQKDLERIFHMPKSSATDTLQVLEKEGIIERVVVEDDVRRKQIVLTEKGLILNKKIEEQIDEVEKYVQQDIPEEEMDLFFKILLKMKDRATQYKSDIN